MSIITSYPTSAATSPYPKMVKSLFNRYFSFSNKVFYPVAYIMNGPQHLTTLKSLKICLALLFIWPELLKIWPQLSPGWPQLFSFGERDGDSFFTAREDPEFFSFLKCFLSFKMSSSTFESQLHSTLQNFSIDLIEQFIVGYALTLSKTCPCFYLSAVHVF